MRAKFGIFETVSTHRLFEPFASLGHLGDFQPAYEPNLLQTTQKDTVYWVYPCRKILTGQTNTSLTGQGNKKNKNKEIVTNRGHYRLVKLSLH